MSSDVLAVAGFAWVLAATWGALHVLTPSRSALGVKCSPAQTDPTVEAQERGLLRSDGFR